MNRSEIEKRATQVLRDHDLLELPVNPLKVAHALGVKVMNAVFSEPEKSGAIVKRGKAFSIFVNANNSPSRKRFTIAHEIGHKLLHMSSAADAEFVDTEDNFRSEYTSEGGEWTEERRKEWEANVFASALLMNAEAVRAEWKEAEDPVALAWRFQVSVPAMVVRLTQLGLLEALP